MHSAQSQLLRIAAAASVGLMMSGAILYRTAPPTSFGWYAYSPLAEEMAVPPRATRTTRQRIGLILAAPGLAAASAVAAYAVGRSA